MITRSRKHRCLFRASGTSETSYREPEGQIKVHNFNQAFNVCSAVFIPDTDIRNAAGSGRNGHIGIRQPRRCTVLMFYDGETLPPTCYHVNYTPNINDGSVIVSGLIRDNRQRCSRENKQGDTRELGERMATQLATAGYAAALYWV